jgi:hypothetical protein
LRPFVGRHGDAFHPALLLAPLQLEERKMHLVLAKTFGGLSPTYYSRQFIFGLAFAGFIYAMTTHGNRPLSATMIALLVINTLLYPYSRFVYESVVDFIVGQNVLFANAVLFLAVKIMSMALCWAAAVFIAPVGLVYFYFHHGRASE